MITESDTLPLIEAYFARMNPDHACNIPGQIIGRVDHDGHNDMEAVIAVALGRDPIPYVSPTDRIKRTAEKYGIQCRNLSLDEHYYASFYKPIKAPFVVTLHDGPCDGESYEVDQSDCDRGWFELEPISAEPLIWSDGSLPMSCKTVTIYRYNLIPQELKAVYAGS